eukprot:6166939-Amphidinium_carterae.1
MLRVSSMATNVGAALVPTVRGQQRLGAVDDLEAEHKESVLNFSHATHTMDRALNESQMKLFSKLGDFNNNLHVRTTCCVLTRSHHQTNRPRRPRPHELAQSRGRPGQQDEPHKAGICSLSLVCFFA